jgi:hypothetical protein
MGERQRDPDCVCAVAVCGRLPQTLGASRGACCRRSHTRGHATARESAGRNAAARERHSANTPPAKPAPKPAPRNAPGASQPPPENPEPEHAARPPAPQISPQLSPADQAALEKKTNANVASAEKNLQQAYGRELNSGQHDLVEKINSFLGQAREATRAADWVRANNLAEKAYLLSVELVNSF